MDIYEKSVGGNATLLLNIPPMPKGLLHKEDVKRLKELGLEIQKRYGRNLAEQSEIVVKGVNEWMAVHGIQTDDYDTYYHGNGPKAEFKISWNSPQKISAVILKENILKSQRIEAFEILSINHGKLKKIYQGTTVGYKKIARFPQIETDTLVIQIVDSRIEPTLSFIGIYEL